MASFDLKTHLRTEHNTSPLSVYLREIVYGGNDGIVTTFAVVAGFAGAQSSMTTLPLFTVILFGVANLCADGISMGLGNFLSSRAEHDLYKNEQVKELHEIRTNPHLEEEETIELLKMKGFSSQQAKQLVTIYKTNENYWLDFMMEKELGMSNPLNDNVRLMALTTFLSFVTFGTIPLLPYIFLGAHPNVFIYSIMATVGALVVLGILRYRVTRQSWIRSLGETLLIGGIAATVAYIVGTIFKI